MLDTNVTITSGAIRRGNLCRYVIGTCFWVPDAPPFLRVGYPIHNMPHDARNDAHNRLHARSYYNLDKAQAEATQKNGYHSESTRNVIQLEFLSRFGRNSSFQLNIILSPVLITA